jgi:hypothetical protein
MFVFVKLFLKIFLKNFEISSIDHKQAIRVWRWAVSAPPETKISIDGAQMQGQLSENLSENPECLFFGSIYDTVIKQHSPCADFGFWVRSIQDMRKNRCD